MAWFPGEVDHGGALLWPDPPLRGGHCQAVRGCLHRLDDGPGVTQGLDASACSQGAQYVRPNHSKASVQRFCTKVCLKTLKFCLYFPLTWI